MNNDRPTYYSRNRERLLKQQKEHYHSEQGQAVRKAYVSSDDFRKKDSAYHKLYLKTPKGKLIAYKRGAKSRELSFLLTVEQFNNLISQSCHYCGGEGGGIDRLHRHLGYELRNCVPACYRCNLSKHTMNEQEFMEWITRVYTHMVSSGKVRVG
jgi:hypothetical protein